MKLGIIGTRALLDYLDLTEKISVVAPSECVAEAKRMADLAPPTVFPNRSEPKEQPHWKKKGPWNKRGRRR